MIKVVGNDPIVNLRCCLLMYFNSYLRRAAFVHWWIKVVFSFYLFKGWSIWPIFTIKGQKVWIFWLLVSTQSLCNIFGKINCLPIWYLLIDVFVFDLILNKCDSIILFGLSAIFFVFFFIYPFQMQSIFYLSLSNAKTCLPIHSSHSK